MADWKDILSNEEEKTNDEELMKYLEGTLSEEEKHAFEQKAGDSQFDNDALEGLEHFKNKEKLNLYVNQLNKNLRDNLTARKSRKDKRKIKDGPWALLTLIILLAICVLVYILIRIYHRQATKHTSAPTTTITVNRSFFT